MTKLIIFTCFLFIHLVLAEDQPKVASLIDERIIGGQEVSISQYPYQVSLEYSGTQLCGGALIGRTWVLTAAHCFDGYTTYPTNWNVRVASSFRNRGGQLLDVSTTIVHQYYSNTTYDYDIAIVHMKEPVALSNDARVVRLPNNINHNVEGFIGAVSGWGTIVEDGNPSEILRAVQLPVMTQATCRELHPALMTERMICAGYYEGGVAACAGDGGGPLVVDDILVGLVSWARGCAQAQRPGVYANIAAFRDWITTITGI